MSTATAAYMIPDVNMTELRTRVTKLARRCAKLGLPELALIEHKPAEIVRYRRRAGDPLGLLPSIREVLACTWCELTGAVPLVDGWLFLAKVEHTPAGNIVSAPASAAMGPSYDLTAYRTAEPVCEHCHSARNRKDTFVLRSPDGEIKQIGRNCLADFLRCEDVEAVVGIVSLLNLFSRDAGCEGDEESFGGGGWRNSTSTDQFVACAVSACRKDGFKPASFQEGSTRSRAAFLSDPCPEGNTYESAQAARDWEDNQPTAEDTAKAALVLAWVKESTDSSDFMHNLRIAAALPAVEHRGRNHGGLLAAAVCSYERAMGREAVRKAERAATASSEYQGKVGERSTWLLTVVRKASWESTYGTTVLHIMADATGNVFAWAKSGDSDTLEIGRTYSVKGTVKRHEEYKGTKQTTLSRCVASDPPDPNAPPPPAKVRKPRAPKGFALPGSNQFR